VDSSALRRLLEGDERYAAGVRERDGYYDYPTTTEICAPAEIRILGSKLVLLIAAASWRFLITSHHADSRSGSRLASDSY
jgi:hypothetical protein